MLEGCVTLNERADLDVTVYRSRNDQDEEVSIEVTYGKATIFSIRDQSFDVDACRRFGRAVRNNTLLNVRFINRIDGGADALDGELFVAAARCINAFFAEIKYNTYVVNASLDLTMGLSMYDLAEFIHYYPKDQ
jgi:hypothetical protein